MVNTSTNAVVQRMDYDEFGNLLFDSNPDFTPFGFAGGLSEQQTKLTRFGVRDYDASVGKWTSKDPILFEGNELNLYAYGMIDPTNLTDPMGLRCSLIDIWSRAATNFKRTNETIPGLTVPGVVTAARLLLGDLQAQPNSLPSLGLGMYMRMTVAQHLSRLWNNPTLMQWALSGFKGTGSSGAVQVGTRALGLSAGSAIIVSFAFEAGVAYGSLFAAIYTECVLEDPCR